MRRSTTLSVFLYAALATVTYASDPYHDGTLQSHMTRFAEYSESARDNKKQAKRMDKLAKEYASGKKTGTADKAAALRLNKAAQIAKDVSASYSDFAEQHYDKAESITKKHFGRQ